jgi:hypothetical protein
LVGNDSVLNISSGNLIVSNIVFSGNWKIHISEHSSAEMQSVFINHAEVDIVRGGQFSARRLSASRRSGAASVLRIDANEAVVEISDSLFNDSSTGTLLHIVGDSNQVLLFTVTFLSTDPLSSQDLLSVYATGLTLALDRSNVTVLGCNFQWCGLGAVKLAGIGTALALHASHFLENTAVTTAGESGSGGVVDAAGPGLALSVVNCSIVGHWADTYGGGIASDDPRATIAGCWWKGPSLMRTRWGSPVARSTSKGCEGP